MVKNSIENEKMYLETSRLLEPLGYKVVDVRASMHASDVDIMVTIMAIGREVTIDDCSAAHRVLYPHFSLSESHRDVSLEVSTPGIQRNLRDIHEFVLFKSRRCRIYDSDAGTWVEGVIGSVADGNVQLLQAKIDDTNETHESYTIGYERIQKAKLAYAWEDIS